MMNLKHDFEKLVVQLNGGWGNSKIATQTDYDGGVGPILTVPAALARSGAVCALFRRHSSVSAFDIGVTNSDGNTGIIGGHIASNTDRYQAIDLNRRGRLPVGWGASSTPTLTAPSTSWSASTTPSPTVSPITASPTAWITSVVGGTLAAVAQTTACALTLAGRRRRRRRQARRLYECVFVTADPGADRRRPGLPGCGGAGL
ncbi:MAG: hypothetical protein R3C40_07450 [Parvularculaceae bacterium]